MERNQPKTRLVPALAVVGILCAVLVVAYLAGYFVLGPEIDDSFPGKDRAFATRWQAKVYIPAAFIEAKVTGTSVSLLTGHYIGRDYDSYVEIERLDP